MPAESSIAAWGVMALLNAYQITHEQERVFFDSAGLVIGAVLDDEVDVFIPAPVMDRADLIVLAKPDVRDDLDLAGGSIEVGGAAAKLALVRKGRIVKRGLQKFRRVNRDEFKPITDALGFLQNRNA